ncbi:MAG: Gfo/Idh/MocA family oxidoreductase [Bacteroidales bacterium]|jgi:predicted dehydrogenase|nr:Gfo/Idh/MocA family oxidoreductase [Bacteroidales bacterium]
MIKWGIIGLGKIAHKFAEGLTYVANAELYGIASSNRTRALMFAEKHPVKKVFDNYEFLAMSEDIDVIYIASYNHLHAKHVKLCMKHGKHVLCEKPLTTSSANTRELFALAQEKKLFLMEALWTRFLPSIAYLEELVQSGSYGPIKHIDVSFGFVAPKDPKGRLLNPKLGGGVLFDIGIYPLFLCQLLLGSFQKSEFKVVRGPGNVDIHTTIKNIYPGAQATILCSFREQLANEAIIQFEKATVILKSMWHCPTKVILSTNGEEKAEPILWKGNGYNYEAAFVSDLLEKGEISQEKLSAEFSTELIKQIEEMLNTNSG